MHYSAIVELTLKHSVLHPMLAWLACVYPTYSNLVRVSRSELKGSFLDLMGNNFLV
jgi:hypothetical protein